MCEVIRSKTKANLGTRYSIILARETVGNLTGFKARLPDVHQFPVRGPLFCWHNAVHISETKPGKRRGGFHVLLANAPPAPALWSPPLWRKLANCLFLLQYFNQYFWSPSKYGLLSSVWCNRWAAHRARASAPLRPAARCTRGGDREGKSWFVVAT